MNVTAARSGAADAESLTRVQVAALSLIAFEKQTGEKPSARGEDRPVHA